MDARSNQYLFENLPENYKLFRGCLKFPGAPISVNPMHSQYAGWREAMGSFTSLIRALCKRHNWDFQWRAKQHITWDYVRNCDDMHYDWIGFHDIPLNHQYLRKKILALWNQACMGLSTAHSSFIPLERESPKIHFWCNYTYKFAHKGTKEYDLFMQYHYLPMNPLRVTWESSDFWKCEPSSQEVVSNGKRRIIQLSKLKTRWVQYIQSFAGDGIPEFQSDDFKELTRVENGLKDIIDNLDYSIRIDDEEMYQSH